MSKIFEAYRKKMGDLADLPLAVGQAGAVSLFPAPTGVQKADFNKLANRLLGLRVENRGVVLAFGSSTAQEGASYVSYNTALYLADVYHQKVAWIDGNFLSPQKKLKKNENCSFASLLKDPESVRAIETSLNPFLISAGNNLQEARGLLADSNFATLLRNLSERFDYIILDLPPVLGSTDTALMASNADGFLLVIEQKNLKTEVIEHGIRGMREKGAHILGSIINRRTFDLPKVIYDRL